MKSTSGKRRWGLSLSGPVRLFNRLSFRTKFALVGWVLAAPLCLLAGFAASQANEAVRDARDRQLALDKGALVRELMVTLALHRTLSAAVLAGGEGNSTALVALQPRILVQVQEVNRAFGAPPWSDIGLPDPEGLGEEVRALMRMPNSEEPERNFERHNEVIDALRAVVYRIGLGASPGTQHRKTAGAYDMAFVTLPALIEDLARQRGAGGAVLTQRQYSQEELARYLVYAGGAAQRLQHVRADRYTMRLMDAALAAAPVSPAASDAAISATDNNKSDGAGDDASSTPLLDALTEAEIFNRRSIDLVLSRTWGEDAAADHGREAATAIEGLQHLNRRMAALLLRLADGERARAERERGVAVAALVAVVLLLAAVYNAFERSTVLRLGALKRASQRLAVGDFDDSVQVDGSDEIASLASAMDVMRRHLREAVSERAGALAARASDRAKTDFLARWSHDLRTPLAAMLGYARLLGERAGPLSGEQRGDLQRVMTAGEHLLELVNDVLEIASVEAGEVALRHQPVQLDRVAADALDLAQPTAAAAGITLALHAAADPVWALGDRTRLLQVVSNLVSNAIKFNRPQGRVWLELARVGDHVCVSVSDSGEGMAAAHLPRLFIPFERLDADARGIRGTGLGLATVKRLAEGMQGRVEVTSTPGAGSRFTVWLLACDAPPTALANAAAADACAARAAGAPILAGTAPRLRGRVAYVEDNEVNVELLRALLLNRTDIELHVMRDGAQALQHAGAVDLWIIDRQLPDTDGVALWQTLKLRHPQAVPPAVMFSADAMPRSREAALAAGFADFWTKPMDFDAVLASMARLLGQSR